MVEYIHKPVLGCATHCFDMPVMYIVHDLHSAVFLTNLDCSLVMQAMAWEPGSLAQAASAACQFFTWSVEYFTHISFPAIQPAGQFRTGGNSRIST